MNDTNPQKSRRNFIKVMAQSAGASAALSAFPASIAKALSIPPDSSTGSIEDVKHVVIFMQENRSFDHYFGTLKGVRGFGDPRPALMRNGKPVWFQPIDSLHYQLPFPLKGNGLVSNDRTQCLDDDPAHAWKYSQKMWAYHDVWVREKAHVAMGYMTRADLPFYYALADAFTIGDAYHASVFGPTDPNRMFLFSGTNGLSVGKDGRHTVSNVDDANETSCMQRDKKDWKSPYTWTSYAERLSEHQISWKVYQEYDNFGDNSLAYFPQFRNLNLEDPTHKDRYLRARSYAGETTQLDAKGLPLNSNTPDAQALVDAFANDVRSGQLPAVSWIVAPTKFCEHPEKNPASFGESLTSRIIDVLTADPKVWSQTVLIICYDEEGGFFDHVPPPTAPVSRHDGYSTVSVDGETSGGESIGLGIRVPLLVVSPWTRGGWVCSEVFDHTSVIRFLEKRFGVQEPNISAWRRTVCGDLTSAFDFSNCDQERPEALLQTPHQEHIARANASCQGPKSAEVDKVATLITQEQDSSGNTRPARALPYQLQVHGQLNLAQESFEIQFENTGKAGAVFTVYPTAHNGGPWYYTVASRKMFTESWKLNGFGAEKYTLRVHGPNGFLRVFQGKLSQTVEVKFFSEKAGAQLRIELHNPGNTDCRLLLSDMFYGAPDQNIELAANSDFKLMWDTTASFGWYDIRISISNDAHYLRRFAGHLENGTASRSDPANGKLKYEAELKVIKI